MDPKIAKLAKEAIMYFTYKTRESTQRDYITLIENHPDWVQRLVHFAHGELLPDDYRYKMVYHALLALYDTAGDRDEAAESSYLEAPIYTSYLTDWLSSHSSRVAYCDEAIETFGDMMSITTIIQEGYRLEATEVLDLVVSFLGDLENTEEE